MKEHDLQNNQAPNSKPMVSVVVPAFNEAELISSSLARIYDYMLTIDKHYRWELIVVNDGSSDETGELAESFAQHHQNVVVLHHFVNFNVGQALKYAFNNSKGDYVVVMDMDLSYSPEHIGMLLDTARRTGAKIVAASPYMKGGKITGVPWLRRTLSICANKFLSYTSKGDLSTLTGMVRAYDGRFLRSLSLRSMDMSICAEIIYKAMVIRAKIVEVPAHLDWSVQNQANRKSSIRIKRSILAYMLSGFMFRPFFFFILPGCFLFILACYSFGWSLIHSIEQYLQMSPDFGSFAIRLSAAVASAFEKAPHTFIIGGTALMISIQLISLGILSLQNKRYFEEIFYLGSSVYKSNVQDGDQSLRKVE